jgi:hypothetical protein
VVFFLLTGIFSSGAQNQFMKIGVLGDDNVVTDIVQDFNGDFLICFTHSDNGRLKSGLLKLNSFGDTIFSRLYSSQQMLISKTIDLTKDSNYIISGLIDNGTASTTFCISKISQSGNLIWSKFFGDSLNISGYRNVICRSVLDSGFIVGISYKDTALTTYALLRLDNNGDTIWCKRYLDNGHICDLVVTADTGFAILGDDFLFKTDKGGHISWTRRFLNHRFQIGAIVNGSDYDLTFTGSDTSNQFYLFKIDTFGNFLWSKVYGTTNIEASLDLKKTLDGGYVIGGFAYDNQQSRGNAILIRTDSLGDTLSVSGYEGQNYLFIMRIIQTIDHGFLLGGYTKDIVPSYTSKILILKADSLGNLHCNNVNYPLSVHNFQLQDSVINISFISGFPIIHDTILQEAGVLIYPVCSINFVKDNPSNPINIYPNPANCKVKIESRYDLSFELLEIYNLTGVRILSKQNFTDGCEIDLSTYAKGIYVLVLKSNDQIFINKVVLE